MFFSTERPSNVDKYPEICVSHFFLIVERTTESNDRDIKKESQLDRTF